MPGNVSQAKYVGNILKELKCNVGDSLKNHCGRTRRRILVESNPEFDTGSVTEVNITMGLPLSKTPLASLFSQFFRLYINKDAAGWFYQPVLGPLSHPYLKTVWANEPVNRAKLLAENIRKHNHTYLSSQKTEHHYAW